LLLCAVIQVVLNTNSRSEHKQQDQKQSSPESVEKIHKVRLFMQSLKIMLRPADLNVIFSFGFFPNAFPR